MQPLEKSLRNLLEKTVKDARDVAEDAARAALTQLGVGEALPFSHLTESERELRRRLRAHGRQLGDRRDPENKTQDIDRLVEEVAYEHWHRMLFARFLAENNLLMYPDPDDPVPVTLEECEDLAADEGAKNGWELAARFAAGMLPQIFRPSSPVFQLELPPEYQQKLERLLVSLPTAVFTASDSLGWVYQFWQAKKKDEVNASEVKIGARELPAVTQLFTEPYMVSFLLDNSLGAWWAARRLTPKELKNAASEEELRQKAALPGVPLEYLRFIKVEAASSRLGDKSLEGSSTVEAASSRLGDKSLEGSSTVEAASSRLKEIGYFHKDNEIANLSGNLPHWRQEGVTYFVTFRTADSLPQEKLKAWQAEKNEWLKQHPEPHSEKTRKEFYEKFPARIQKWLDQGYGECLLKEPEYKAIVEKALRHFDGKRYELDEFVVMPNHVHVIVTPESGYELSTILHSWKSFTATQINERRKSSGAFWQKESFDHIVRSPEQLERIRAYIRDHFRFESRSGFQPLEFNKKRLEAASTFTWTPAAGIFDGWPEDLREFKVLDPCCGSGHFLVAALLMLVPMRMELEGLTPQEAVDAVLRDNLHGLEIDQRCVELAAFALALAAWRYPGAGGYRKLPELNLACSGLSVSVSREEWQKLANGNHNLRIALGWIYDEFQNAPVLGSLLDPSKIPLPMGISWKDITGTLEIALKKERSDEEKEAGIVAHGLAKAANMLAGKYHWIITNLPYLARGKQSEKLKKFCATHYKEAKNDLATVFLDRCLEMVEEPVEEPSRLLNNKAAGSRFYSRRAFQALFSQAAGSRFYSGTVSLVMPQNWLFLTSYKKFREKLLINDTWHLIARLGPGAFETISGEVVKAILITLSRGNEKGAGCRVQGTDLFSRPDTCSLTPAPSLICGLDVSEPRTAAEKANQLLTGKIKSVEQAKQLENPDARVTLEDAQDVELLEVYANGFQGIASADYPHFGRYFWEIIFKQDGDSGWVYQQSTVQNTCHFGGKQNMLYWENGMGELANSSSARVQGLEAWGKWGIAAAQMREIPVTLHTATSFDNNTAAIIPNDESHLPAIWCFCSSPEYNEAVRQIDQSLKVTNATLVKVPFDLDHWTKVAEEKYPNGLPKPYTNDPTQWIFHGHPCGSVIWDKEKKWTAHGPLRTDSTVLQVAVARLLGYRWPAEGRSGFQPLERKEPGRLFHSRSGFQPLEKQEPGRLFYSKNGFQPLSENTRQDGAFTMELADEQREWVERCDVLLPFADEDGIVCIPPVRGELPAADRLLGLLAAAHKQVTGNRERGAGNPDTCPLNPETSFSAWTNQLLAAADHGGKSLETWLRDKFFAQHCKLFHHRPFIWHIWDGLRDGFAALVNYHKLDRKNLETLIYTYLGDWINRQKRDCDAGVDGAEEKLAAAISLKKKLELILKGESPYDIFVRWKPIDKQPIGWEPDLNDGVRLNIRPFMTVGDVRKKGAGILRDKPNIHWTKDRGKDVPSAPWYHLGTQYGGKEGDRINDHHLTLDEKRRARKEVAS